MRDCRVPSLCSIRVDIAVAGQPMQHDEHMSEHMEKGDFKRWGARANQTETMTPERIRQLEMEAETEAEMERNLNRVPSQPTDEPPE